MRAWYKFIVTDQTDVATNQPISSSFEEIASEMGGFEETSSYACKEEFFKTFFYDEHRRIKDYGSFIEKRLAKDQTILSLGSGRCVSELMLMEHGYHVTGSDLETPHSYRATKALFPGFKHIQLNILSAPSPSKYEAILCLSVIYLFDNAGLRRFFANVHKSLKDGGHLIFDSPGSPDNLLSYSLHDILLKYEAKANRWIKSITKRTPHVIITKQHGYRRTDREILESASFCGFELAVQENYDFLTELERSTLLRKLMSTGRPVTALLERVGKNIPYTRMYDLIKV